MTRKVGASPRGHPVIAIGSRNAAKTTGVRRAFSPFFADAEFKEVDVTALVKTQPMTLDETVQGARRRSEIALSSGPADFGVGVEAGVVELGKTALGHYLNLQVAAIVDSAGRLSFGCSSGFPLPLRLVNRMREGGLELDRYARELTGAKKVREEDGIIYHLSDKRLSRVEMTEECVSMALLPWLNPKPYGLG
jgi:inosine/xanthosine triphosphatase